MMRIVSFVLVCLLLAAVSAQEGGGENQPQGEQKAPTTMQEYGAMIRAQVGHLKKEWGESPATLAEAHVRLEQILSPETLAKIDAMGSEDDMTDYHRGLGMNIRNGWGLWRGSALAKHMENLGFTHADDMSGAILRTFWCKRHGQDFRLEARAAEYRKFWEEQENRTARAQAALRNNMMGLRFEKRDVPVVPITICEDGAKVRFLCPFRGGVFFTIYRPGRMRGAVPIAEGYYDDSVDGELRLKPEYDAAVVRGFCLDRTERRTRKMRPGEDFYTQGYYFDPGDRKIHRIRVEETDEVYATVVAGDRAWFAGLTDGKPILVGVGDEDRITVALPQADEIPDLGLDDGSLLAVYTRTIYRLTDRTWTVVHSGDILLPRSGPPPQRHGNIVYLRDEGGRIRQRRLWWLTMSEPSHLSVLDRDAGVLAGGPLLFSDVLSYCVASNGDSWVCAGGDSLFRRSQDGSYSIAIVNGSVGLSEDFPDSEATDQGLHVSAVAALPDDSLLLVGDSGLYRLKGNELVQELAFAPQYSSGQAVAPGTWKPSNVLVLDSQSYFIGGGSWRGVYLLRQGDDGQWSCQSAGRGDPVVW